MNIRIFKQAATLFTRIATAVFTFSSVYIAICFGVKCTLDLSYIWGVLTVSVICSLARIPFMGEKEISKSKMLAANIIYFLFVNTTVLITGYYLKWFYFNELKMIIGMEITVILIYAAIIIIYYNADLQVSDKMNAKLKTRQKSLDTSDNY